jgi:hypothetical protein
MTLDAMLERVELGSRRLLERGMKGCAAAKARLHGSLGWLTPVEYEQDHYAASAESRNPHEGGRETVTPHPALPQPLHHIRMDEATPEPA